ncbi:MAG: electron transporter RnfD [Oscillospiraceae bacterium]|nr:electron transporter RnfD [Oscillospiraceae bacterium]
MKIRYDSPLIHYSGRIDLDEKGAHWYFPSTSATVKFKGTNIGFTVTDSMCWGIITLGYVIDGRLGRVPLLPENNGKSAFYIAAADLEPDKEHTFTLFKRMAANHSCIISDLETDGEFIGFTEHYDLALEFYGDSVSAGEVSEADDFVGRGDPANADAIYDNSYFSYTWQVSRLLNAKFHNISQGGIAVFDGTGYFHMPQTIGMESVYDKACYFPEAGEPTSWDFSKYVPDIAVFALGQNDNHNSVTNENDIDIYDKNVRQNWKDGYKRIITDICGKYEKLGKNIDVILLTTVLMHDPEWDKAIDEAVQELCRQGIKAHHFIFSRNGAATPGHPRRAEHSEMAFELAAEIDRIRKIK